VETLRQIEQQTEQIRGLRDIVQSMRTLASTYLKRAEAQLEPVRLYHRTVVRALSVALGGSDVGQPPSAAKGTRTAAHQARKPHSSGGGRPAIVLFATEQGLCGRFNEVMVDALTRVLRDHPHARVVVLGQRGRGVVESADIRVYRTYPAVTSPDGIPGAIRRTAEELYRLYDRGGVGAIYFLHAVHRSIGRFDERFERVLPLDVAALMRVAQPPPDAESRPPAGVRGAVPHDTEIRPSPSPLPERERAASQPPLTYLPRDVLRRRLIEEYYFIRFYWAFVETVASENSVRLQSMEAARANIEDSLADLESRRRILRQNEITEELMDVISGAEAVTRRRRKA